jgi:anaerobic magnesium-protoporphyrin IX monomethyl ester cyclase
VTADPVSSMLLGADAHFRGEAERVFPEYCKSVIAGERQNETYSCGQIKNLDGLTHPARHLFKERRYRFTPVLASRGCPFDCIYCSMAKSALRRRDIAGLRAELEALARGNPKSIDFIDDVFTLDRQFALDISATMAEIDIPWACTTRADLVDRELLAHMADAGCRYVSFGVESGSERVRHYAGKCIGNSQYVDAFRWCADAGISTRAYAMLGLPGETKADIKTTFEFMRRLDPSDIMYSPAIIFPGTRLMQHALEEGAADKNAWARYILGNDFMPVYTPPGMSAGEIAGLCFEESKRFYLKPGKILERARNAQSLEDVTDCLKAAAAYFMEPVIKY